MTRTSPDAPDFDALTERERELQARMAQSTAPEERQALKDEIIALFRAVEAAEGGLGRSRSG